MEVTNWFKPLRKEDIFEKIEVNHKDHGYTAAQLREKLADELAQHRRHILFFKYKHSRKNLLLAFLTHRKYWKVLMPLEVEAQNLEEQIDYIDQLIKSKERAEWQPATPAR